MAQRREKPGSEAPEPLAPESLSFEAALAELEQIVDRIEQGEVGLEESLRQFRRGNDLVRRCRSILDAAEQQVRELASTPSDQPASDASPPGSPAPDCHPGGDPFE